MYTPLNKRIVSKRTGKNTVALVGFAESTRGETPWDDLDTEIWGLNEAAIQPWFKRFTRWFQIHPEDNFMRSNNPNDPKHPEWLKNAKDFPIYMQKQYDEIPASVALPLNDIVAKYGNYMTSTFSYMISLAMLEGFERIEVYGFDMGTRTEYHYQRANAEYLIGLARGLGFEVYLPTGCSLCKGKMYGFESLEVIFRQRMEYRKNNLEVQKDASRDEAKEAGGKLDALEQVVKLRPDDSELIKLYEDQKVKTQQSRAQANFMVGCFKEAESMINLYDDHLDVVGVGHKQDRTAHQPITEEAKND